MEKDVSFESRRTALLSKLIRFPLRIITYLGKGKSGVFIMTVILITTVSGTIYLARTKPELLGIQTTVEESNGGVSEVENLISEVGIIIALPEGELPTVATVTDSELTREQPFFANAQNGDRVLIYQSAKKAYLYRPSEKRIIEVGVVNIEQTENIILEEVSPTPQPTTTITSTTSPTTFITPTNLPTPTATITPTLEP